jgi:phenylpyruvate tautomerase PptA (4-oxalocrotonate tautomerase family)
LYNKIVILVCDVDYDNINLSGEPIQKAKETKQQFIREITTTH